MALLSYFNECMQSIFIWVPELRGLTTSVLIVDPTLCSLLVQLVFKRTSHYKCKSEQQQNNNPCFILHSFYQQSSCHFRRSNFGTTVIAKTQNSTSASQLRDPHSQPSGAPHSSVRPVRCLTLFICECRTPFPIQQSHSDLCVEPQFSPCSMTMLLCAAHVRPWESGFTALAI